MDHPEPLQQAARELAEKYRWSGMNINALPALCEALLTEPRDEWRDAMDDVFFKRPGGIVLTADNSTEQPEPTSEAPSEDYRRRACEELNRLRRIRNMSSDNDWGPEDYDRVVVHTVARLLQRIDAVEAKRDAIQARVESKPVAVKGPPPEWARQQAKELANAEHGQADMGEANLLAHSCYMTAFARYIASYETTDPTPEDPNLLLAREAADNLIERLTKRRDSTAQQIENCKRMCELLQPEWDRFEARTGHNVYVARDYADHTSAIRRETKLLEELDGAIAALRALKLKEQGK